MAAFAAYLYEAMPESRTFASLSTLAENFFKNQKTVQHSEKFFHFWKFVHYTERFEHGAERRHTYAASFLLICENDAIVIGFFCLFVSLLRFRICVVGGTNLFSGGFIILTR